MISIINTTITNMAQGFVPEPYFSVVWVPRLEPLKHLTEEWLLTTQATSLKRRRLVCGNRLFKIKRTQVSFLHLYLISSVVAWR